MATLNDNTISSLNDLMSAIGSFLTGSAGFTEDEAPPVSGNGQAGWSIGDLYVQMEWTSQNNFTIHQSTGVGSAPLSPGDETGDSGYPQEVDFFGVNITQAEVWGFTNGDTAGDTDTYAYFVVEFNRDGRFAHFGFGHIPSDHKVGSWTGGAFKYGFTWAGSSSAENPAAIAHRLLLDGNHSGNQSSSDMPTMRVSGHPAQPAGSKWCVSTNSSSSPASNDQDGDSVWKIEGYSRHGRWPEVFYPFRGDPNNASVILIPIEFDMHVTSTQRELLGRMPGVRGVNIGNFQPKQTVTLGSRTWQFFPWAQKLTDGGTGVMSSRHAGIAYEVV